MTYTVFLDRYEVKEEDGRQTLVIKDLKLTDAGDFSCRIGDRETSAKLQVEEGQFLRLHVDNHRNLISRYALTLGYWIRAWAIQLKVFIYKLLHSDSSKV